MRLLVSLIFCVLASGAVAKDTAKTGDQSDAQSTAYLTPNAPAKLDEMEMMRVISELDAFKDRLKKAEDEIARLRAELDELKATE